MFIMKKKSIWFYLFICSLGSIVEVSDLYSQNINYTVNGTVYDELKKTPLEFATVYIQDEKKKTIVNNGQFSVLLKKPGEYTLIISAPDFQNQTQKVILSEAVPVQTIQVYLSLNKIQSNAIDITGKREIQKLARQTMKQEEINEVPATLGDSINALGSFAGIDQFAMLGGLGPLIIRGADPFSNRFYIDGIPVNSIQHMLGLHSVINNDLINQIDVYSSAAPARYGNSALGGVVEINTIDSVKKFGGHFELGILSVNGSLSSPILTDSNDPESSIGYWFISGRYGYLTALLPPLLKAATGESPGLPQYYDYQAKGKYFLTKNHSLSILLLGFGDSMDTSPASDTTKASTVAAGADPFSVDITALTRITSHIQSLGYEYSPSEKLRNNLKVYSALNQSYTYQNLANSNGPSWSKDLERTANPNIFGVKDELMFKLFDNHLTNIIGAEMTYYDFFAKGKGLVPKSQFNGGLWSGATLTENMFDVVKIDQHSGNKVYSAWLDEKLEFGGLTIAGGVRGDYLDRDHLHTIDPKGLISYEFPTDTTLSLGAGSYGSFIQTNYTWFSQAPEIAEATGLQVEKSWHRTAGIEQIINKIFSVKLEGFYNTYDHLFQPASNITVNGKSALGVNSGERTAYGFEVTLAKLKQDMENNFYGWINYTYMQGKEKTGLPLNFDPQGDQWINNQYVRNHSLKIVAAYKFGANTIGTRFRLMSSLPYTPITGDDKDPFRIGRYAPVYGDRFSKYLPIYHQLDIRFSRSNSHKWGKVSWYIELQDIYNNHAPVQDWKYNKPYETGKNPTVSTSQGLGLLPSFGVEINF